MLRKLCALIALTTAVVIPSVAMAQHARPAHITVSKATGSDNPDAGMFTSIQAAVNRAEPGQIIEIIDTEVYEEQITIDGRDESPWPGVVGGKNGITIRSSNPTSVVKPVIRFRDTQNRSPNTIAEARTPGELPGSSGNFETCGALRIIRAQNVTIDGITVDGGSPAPFDSDEAVWGTTGLFHGNAAITLVVASNATIRNCELRNAYFGLNVKDRNTGGVFGNPNPADNDVTVPLSGFGKVGGHLIEHNRVHKNSLAFFFESAWDLGSSVRYNMIYDNFHTAATLAALANIKQEPEVNQATGGFLFKDVVYTPVAIYNNTFYNNYANYYAHWKVGATHLIFNNIHGKSSNPIGAQLNYVGGMGIDDKFPFRMHNSIFAALSALDGVAYIQGCATEVPGYFNYVSIVHYFNQIAATIGPVTCPNGQTVQASAFHQGTPLTSSGGLSAAANVFWLETSVRERANGDIIPGTEDLFESTDPASRDFLRPKWTHDRVARFIKNNGWESIGIRNSDGSPADIGAVPSSAARQPTVARVKPSNVVMVSGGTTADLSFFITLNDGGVLNNPRIKFLRWVAPLPTVASAGNFGRDAPVVPSGAIEDITPPTGTNLAVNSNNTVRITLPRTMTAADEYGFFEIVVEGTDGAGHTVTSDIGFLPYRKLEYTLKLEVLHPTNNTVLDTVTAGEQYRLRVTALQGDGNPFTTGPLKDLTFDLISNDPASQMFCHESAGAAICAGGNPLTASTNVTSPRTYPIYFTRSGNTVIMSAGLYELGANRLVFLGNTEIVVIAGPPAGISFISPIPRAQLGGALAPIINRGADREVLVEVQDRFGNAVGAGHQVTISAANSDLSSPAPTAGSTVGTAGSPADIGVKTVATDATGTAVFVARTVDGVPGNVFDMTATVTLPGGETVSDVGSLRVGRTLDALAVFYADAATGYDPDVKIDGNVGQWFKITVKAVVGDSVLVGRNQFIRADGDPGLIFAASEGGDPTNVFSLVNGVAEFWVTANEGINDACVYVTALRANNPDDEDGSIGRGSRCDIKFDKPTSSIERAIVYGDGHGRPDSLVIRYMVNEVGGFISEPALFPLPDSVALRWPSLNDDNMVKVTARSANITVIDNYTLGISFSGINSVFPAGYTDISSTGVGLVTVYGGILGPTSEDEFFGVLDGIGPVVSDSEDKKEGAANPAIVENPNRGTTPDTLIVMLSERIGDELDLEGTASIFYVRGPAAPNNAPATGGAPLNVSRAFVVGSTSTYRLVLAADSDIPEPGDWVRINPASAVRDRAATPNAPHANNRWVRVIEKQVPPGVEEGWYTSNPATGLLDSAYIRFNKDIDLDDWFDGGFFNFSGLMSGPDARDFVSPMNDEDGNPRIVRVCLRQAFPASQASVRTSGSISVNVGFNASKYWDPIENVILSDKAKPVLMPTVLLKFGVMDEAGENRRPDTLTVTYSEVMPAGVTSILDPVTITKSSTGPITPNFTSASVVTETTVRYIMDGADRGGIDPANLSNCSECVRINHSAGVTDVPGNEQNVENNRLVDLRLDADLQWRLVISNNPLRSGDDRQSSKFNLTSGMAMDMDATVRIFDNLGNLVRVWKKADLNISATDIAWDWDGRNGKGRLVGSGTYLVIVDVKHSFPGDDKKASKTVRGRIGIVRK